ncbi:transketolase [Roseimicrobium gellanilyticum]|uniref:Transketolase n=1 Tax=Roseimicrobium gellanilyticum TaxID=748857 RepID=A0A366HP06_9BACT|nr:transketolase [Roseimicrobium gellanilyticum]RBP43715.1 transketolase [Roseimicrobium gellanilyticum]
MNKAILQKAANEARGIAMDAVHKCQSGHLGLPLGAAEIGAVLFGEMLQCDPTDPKWLNRDRFILSAGHGSMFIYTWLHLAGYDLPMRELENFRQLHSHTPGHPESFETVGVECTTGPLGQGVANAVGFAISGKMAAAKYNTADFKLLDNHIFVLAGDGCLQEGVAREAVAFAGHNGLDNLILIYDSNDVTLDAMAKLTQSEDTAKVYEGMGWDVITIDGHSFGDIYSAIDRAKTSNNNKPKIIIAKTEIGRGIPEVAGTAKAHGEGGAKFVDAARAALGLPADQHFFVSEEVKAHFSELKDKRVAAKADWQKRFEAWGKANPELKAQLDDALNHDYTAEELLKLIPEYPAEGKAATRNSGGEILNHLAKAIPHMITGSADLFGSTKNYIKDGGDFSKNTPTGRNLWFGIREHAMAAMVNGIKYDGLFRASSATFLVFADYCRASMRIAALAKLPATYIFTHDSVGVGEDGPTHQPVETVSGLRLIPNLDVIRPGDAEECAAAFAAAFSRPDGPTLLALTRQDIPHQGSASAAARREGTLKGGYVLVKEKGDLKTILLASGSEVQHVVEAAKQLGDGVRVVSVPCFERFDRQTQAYRDEVLPPSCTKRVAIEAGVSALWWKYVGTAGKVLGIDRFGISAPGNTVMKELGMTAEAVVKAAS